MTVSIQYSILGHSLRIHLCISCLSSSWALWWVIPLASTYSIGVWYRSCKLVVIMSIVTLLVIGPLLVHFETHVQSCCLVYFQVVKSSPLRWLSRMNNHSMVHDHMMMDSGAEHSMMDHSSMDHSSMDHSGVDHSGMDHFAMDHSAMDHSAMDHSMMKVGSATQPCY